MFCPWKCFFFCFLKLSRKYSWLKKWIKPNLQAGSLICSLLAYIYFLIPWIWFYVKLMCSTTIRGIGWFFMDYNFIFKTGCDMVWLRVSWKKWTGKYIVDWLSGGSHTLSSGFIWLQLGIPGTRKVTHMPMHESVCMTVCLVYLCVLHRKRNQYRVGGRTSRF